MMVWVFGKVFCNDKVIFLLVLNGNWAAGTKPVFGMIIGVIQSASVPNSLKYTPSPETNMLPSKSYMMALGP